MSIGVGILTNIKGTFARIVIGIGIVTKITGTFAQIGIVIGIVTRIAGTVVRTGIALPPLLIALLQVFSPLYFLSKVSMASSMYSFKL